MISSLLVVIIFLKYALKILLIQKKKKKTEVLNFLTLSSFWMVSNFHKAIKCFMSISKRITKEGIIITNCLGKDIKQLFCLIWSLYHVNALRIQQWKSCFHAPTTNLYTCQQCAFFFPEICLFCNGANNTN